MHRLSQTKAVPRSASTKPAQRSWRKSQSSVTLLKGAPFSMLWEGAEELAKRWDGDGAVGTTDTQTLSHNYRPPPRGGDFPKRPFDPSLQTPA